jgi:uncharacterized membrane protein YphA (DoxX/SURF4 family)
LTAYSTQKVDPAINLHVFISHAFLYYFALSIKNLYAEKMKKLLYQVSGAEARLLKWAGVNSHAFLRWSIGMIYILYGGLKFFPKHSPAEQLAVDTIEKLSFGLFSGTPAQITLAIMETVLGLCLVLGWRLRWTVYAAIAHMMGTFLPVFFFPEVVFTSAPTSLSLEGQYILKNFIILGAFFVLYAKTVKKQSKVLYLHSSPEQERFQDFKHHKQYKLQSLTTRKASAN